MNVDPFYTDLCSAATLQSHKKGFFQEFADNITNVAGVDWLKAFGSLTTDSDRILMCYDGTKITELVHNTLGNVQPLFRTKSGRISQQRRLEGERAMALDKADRALLLLTQSIIRAPSTGEDLDVDEGLSLSLAFWCRSKVQFSLHNFQFALIDLQFALKEKLPHHLRSEAYVWMAECYCELQQAKQAAIALQIAEKSAGDLVPELTSLIQSTREKLKLLENSPKEATKSNASMYSTAKLMEGSNPFLPSASCQLGIASSMAAGRFVVAKQPISTADTLIVEDAYAACLIPEKFGSHCLHCFSRLLSAIPCPNCSGVAFCSIGCRDTACSTYHRYECPYMDLLIGSGMSILSHIALRIVSQSSLKHFLTLRPKLAEEMSVEPYIKVYNLVTHETKRPAKDFLHRTLMAIFLLHLLRDAGFFGKNKENNGRLYEDELYICELLLRHLQLLQFNAHEIYETTMKGKNQFRSAKTVYIAVGIYQTAALFNHDCYPAVTRLFQGKSIVVKAVRRLKPNEVVSENYGPVFTKRGLVQRQRELASRYWFSCTCLACQEDWPDFETLDEDMVTFRCPTKECSGCFTQHLSDTTSKAKCVKCKNYVTLEELCRLVKSYMADYTRGLELMDSGETTDAIKLFCGFIEAMEAITKPPNKSVTLCQEALRTCWACEGNIYIIP